MKYSVIIEKDIPYAQTQQASAAECKIGDEYNPEIKWMIVIRVSETNKIVKIPARGFSYADVVRFQNAIRFAFEAGVEEGFGIVQRVMQYDCKTVSHEEL